MFRPVAGKIRERMWYGKDGMEHVRTVKEPKQSIPTFAGTIALLMKVCYVFNLKKFLRFPRRHLSLQNLIFVAGEPTCYV